MLISRLPARPMRPRCPHGRLTRLIEQQLPREFRLKSSGLKPWASASFVGSRHHFFIEIEPQPEPAPPADYFAARLGADWKEKEWRLVGHIVADLSVAAEGQNELRLEILTVEE